MIISVKGFTTPMMLGSRKLLLSQKIGLMRRLIWKDIYVVWDKMKDESDEFRESLKSYCKLQLVFEKTRADDEVSPGHPHSNQQRSQTT